MISRPVALEFCSQSLTTTEDEYSERCSLSDDPEQWGLGWTLETLAENV